MFDDEMGQRISLQSFSSIPRRLGQGHHRFLILVNLTFTTSLTEKLGAAARVENPAFQLSRILAVVVDVALFLPWVQVRGSAPPHLFSTASRCFCVASAVFCHLRRLSDLHCIVRRSALQAFAHMQVQVLGTGLALHWGVFAPILIGGSPLLAPLERGQPRQMTGTWSAAWEGCAVVVWGTFASRFWQLRALQGEGFRS